ncbi:MAG: adenylosuccinate lyase [Phycisphaerae bacterium]|nr:adenylosuccinate lyase [Planctomycetota bacterium]MBL7220427.1 adenylosuccinate lyase [Phycisphaerae bacterium]
MANRHDSYVSPLESRYASRAMRELFSDKHKFTTWRRLWIALARSQKLLGLDISGEQIAELEAHVDDIDYDAAGEYERKFRHDVMAHIHAYGDAAPSAKGIIHLGATSQFVNCNTDLLILRDALGMVAGALANVIDALAKFAEAHRDLPCLGFTHYQPAQMTTVGKRAALWCSEFVTDLAEVERRIETLAFRGVKGTTGTQASFLALFDGDHEKVKQLDKMVAAEMGFDKTICITGQTYSRKIDAMIAQTLAGIGASAHKFCNDVRLLANLKELEEPFESTQVGSSAMAYKRNPMRCERATALARFLMDVAQSPLHTAAEQWFERTLDDSANKRIAMSESFLSADAILNIVTNVARGMVVYPAVIDAHIRAELPFMASENILMAAVQAGGDRQGIHEQIRLHSQAAAQQVKGAGKPNDLIERIKGDPAFASLDIDALLDPSAFVGRAPRQVDEFIAAHVAPVRARYAARLGQGGELNV